MVINRYARVMLAGVLGLLSLSVLTGCPGVGDRLEPDETAQVIADGPNICFLVSEPGDYQPKDMGINPRGTPPKEKHFDFSPALKVTDGELCIPPSYYHFPEKGQFIAEYILASKQHADEPRKVVVTFEVSPGQVHNVPPTDMEITR
ncbi:putative T6SS immunity periplasmic lipoprotein [Salmonella enterica]